MPEKKGIDDDIDKILDEYWDRTSEGDLISPDADLAQDENVEIASKALELEKVEEMNRFTNPRPDGKGPKRMRPYSAREAGRAALSDDPEWDETLSEEGIQEAEERDISLEEKYEEELDRVSLALEFYHNFTLEHDDINDRDDERRSVPTTRKQQREKAKQRGLNEDEAIRHGDNMAMHIGNDLRELAFQTIIDSDFTSEIAEDMQRQLISAGSRIADGQMEDLTMEYIDLSKLFEGEDQPFTDLLIGEYDDEGELYMDMIDKKTVDLYVASVDIGAAAAGLEDDRSYESDIPDEERSPRDHMRRFARNMGIPFQIRDDINEIRSVSSYTEDGEEEGEGIGKTPTDIYNGKTTLPVLTAYQNVSEKIEEIESDIKELDDHKAQVLKNEKRNLEYEKALIEGFYGREDITDQQVQKVADAIYSHETASDLYQEKLEDAMYHLQEADLPGETENLELLAEFMKERNY
jgi:geranylgeranyl pyrophosphate synthase